MIVNETLVARHRETGSAPFALATTDFSLAVTRPDGSTAAGAALAVSPGTSSAVQDLAADFDGAMGGPYSLVWSIAVGDSRLQRQETYFACWTDVYTQVRQLMRNTAAVVTDYDVDITLAQLVMELFESDVFGAELASYDATPAEDRARLDRALALMVAAWLSPFVMKQSPSGPVVSFMSGTDQYKWAPPAKRADGLTNEELWTAKAWELLASTAAFGTSVRAFENVAVGFRASGRRRNQPSAYVAGSFGQLVPNPVYQLWASWADGDGLPWSWCGK